MKRVCGFSGGADSQATALWLRQRFDPDDIILLNSDAGGNEHPVTSEFINWYSENIFPVIQVKPIVADMGNRGTKGGHAMRRRKEFSNNDDLTFDRLAYIKGRFPSAKAQFCTEHLKLSPQRRWTQENLVVKNIQFERYIGVRRDESERRKCAKDCEWDEYFGCRLWRPIASWSKAMVFVFLKEAGEEVNPLYKMGFSRIGCAPCVNSAKGDVREWAARFPEMIDKVREWEKKVGRTFFAPCVPGLEINWIDEVVEWSKTTHGGRMTELPFVENDASTGQCVSKYGLCE